MMKHVMARAAAVLPSIAAGFAAAALPIGMSAVPAAAAPTPQVAISENGAPASGTIASNLGIWIWAQQGVNGYGNQGQGSAYDYQVTVASQAVDVSDVVVSGSSVSAVLTGTTKGPYDSFKCNIAATEVAQGTGGGLLEFDCILAKAGVTYHEVSGTTGTETWVPALVHISQS